MFGNHSKFLGSGVLTFVIAERFRYAKILKIFWQEIIKEYKENLISTEEYNEKENNIEIPIKNHSISTENNSKNSQLYDILQELDIKSNIHPFYEISNENIKIQWIYLQ
ncbi:hypothetical protein RhiirA4_550036 [Rhizophagus irregularis]|uniref:Uncharacterized protein n=1 Tax=Rhizophagus irregularis TaxID=588596 RepID=A0A2I1HHN3_9GLOM|nr:hypothetical protein RhiirA4_550036 [Rhizophagus irregularis]